MNPGNDQAGRPVSEPAVVAFRPMRRHAQQLSQDECEDILRREPRGVLSVLGDGGYPYGIPLDFVYDQGALYFHCAPAGHKLDAVDAYDKASFNVIDTGYRNEGEWWLNIRSVIAFGRVRRVENRSRALEVLHLLAEKYFPPTEDAEADIAKNGDRVVILKLSIDHLSGKAVREK